MDFEKLWNEKEYFAKGKRGYIYRSGKYVIKTKNPDSDKDPVELEAYYNKKLNKIGIGPKFYYFDKKRNFMVREFIDGINVLEWMKDKKKSEIKKVILDILDQCRKMDLAGINKMEMTHPHKDIIIDKKNKPWIIDFERCKETEKPKNVTQFLQFLHARKLIKIEMDEIIEISKRYKKNLSTKVFENIKKIIKNSFS